MKKRGREDRRKDGERGSCFVVERVGGPRPRNEEGDDRRCALLTRRVPMRMKYRYQGSESRRHTERREEDIAWPVGRGRIVSVRLSTSIAWWGGVVPPVDGSSAVDWASPTWRAPPATPLAHSIASMQAAACSRSATVTGERRWLASSSCCLPHSLGEPHHPITSATRHNHNHHHQSFLPPSPPQST